VEKMIARGDTNKERYRKRKVVFFFFGDGAFQYGVAEVFRHILNGLDKERYEPYLVITGSLSYPIVALSEKVNVIELNQRGLKGAFFPFVRTLNDIKPDLVMSAMEHPNVLAVAAKAVSFKPFKLVLTSHSMFGLRLKNIWTTRGGAAIRYAVRWAYPHADHIVCVTGAVRDDLAKYVKKTPKMSVVYNPVLAKERLSKDQGYTKERGLIAVSSRLVHFKKIDEVIRALPYLEPHVNLVVMGDGPERSKLETLVSELSLCGRVHFKGYVQDPYYWYKKAEVFVLPSLFEGFGNVLVESMSCGCQVVANANAGAPAEVLGNGKYGFLYDGGDEKRLADAINEAFERPKPISRLITYSQSFTDERAAFDYAKIIDSLIGTTA